MKLKYNEIAKHRKQKLKEQRNVCPLCNEVIQDSEAALDHCHRTGHIRAVLHRDCNALLGKIENFTQRRTKRLRGEALNRFLSSVHSFVGTDWSCNPLHPKHMTPTDKKIREYKRRIRRAKTEKTRIKYANMIKELQND